MPDLESQLPHSAGTKVNGGGLGSKRTAPGGVPLRESTDSASEIIMRESEGGSTDFFMNKKVQVFERASKQITDNNINRTTTEDNMNIELGRTKSK